MSVGLLTWAFRAARLANSCASLLVRVHVFFEVLQALHDGGFGCGGKRVSQGQGKARAFARVASVRLAQKNECTWAR